MKTRTTRFAIVGCALALSIISLLSPGCKKDEDPGPVVNNNLFSSVRQLTTDGDFLTVSSAVPDASDQFVYFVATGAVGTGVYKVPASGGAASKVFTGAPFSRLMDLALSTDNQTIYVADSGGAAGGGIYALSIGGSTPVLVAGTGGTAAIALDVIQHSGQDVIYFSGRNAADGQKAVFEIPSQGAGAAMVRFSGSPLQYPTGIVSARNGILFIADGGGAAYKLTAATITQLANGITMGTPAGIALTPDDNTLAISSKSGPNGTAQVQIIDLSTGALSIFNKTIGVNEHAGGLHVARNAGGSTGKYAWAGVTGPGRVYRLEP